MVKMCYSIVSNQKYWTSSPKHPGNLNDNRCNNSSSNEAGVLVAIACHGQTTPEGGTYCHWWRDPAPHHCYTPRGGECPLTYPAASHILVLAVPPGIQSKVTSTSRVVPLSTPSHPGY
ncbi:hypothetical protein AVEN_184564-1 [Araneus ventricosus]|uniref:Uncharacterized protein n=1 Tax=Araneus ventricosus TaxID=182803 RepID=A0A4Y2G3Y7_ARAVE|nr:hypothetical protein AVEN_184564-1 [Araneus ventricosus]